MGAKLKNISAAFSGCSSLTNVNINCTVADDCKVNYFITNKNTTITFKQNTDRNSIQEILQGCPWQIEEIYDGLATTTETYTANANTDISVDIMEVESKSLELQGNTLQNLITNPNNEEEISESVITRDCLLKGNTKYTVDFNVDGVATLDLGGTTIQVLPTETQKIITTPNTLTHNQLRIAATNVTASNLKVIEGDYSGENKIDYFEGIESVGVWDDSKNAYKVEIKTENTDNLSDNAIYVGDQGVHKRYKIKVLPNTTYRVEFTATNDGFVYWDEDGNEIGRGSGINTVSIIITTPSNTAYIVEAHNNGNCYITLGTTAYKGNTIKTFYLPCQLNKVIGKTGNLYCDKLYWDETKGHYCIEQNIQKKILNGSEDWQVTSFSPPSNYYGYTLFLPSGFLTHQTALSTYYGYSYPWSDRDCLFVDGYGLRFIIPYSTGLSTVGLLKEYLSNNPITVYYIINAKTIDLADYNTNFGKLRLYGENTNISTNGIVKPSTIAFDHIEA